MSITKPIDDMGRVWSKQLVDENSKLKPYRLQLMDAVVKCLTLSKVDFWMSDGTMLGAWRDGKMIQHDCDIDFSMKECDLNRVNVTYLPPWVGVKYIPNLKVAMSPVHKFNHDVDKYKKIVFIHLNAPEFSFKDELQESSAELDLYTISKVTENSNMWTKNDYRYPQSWSQDTLFPLCVFEFEGRRLTGPRYPEVYLTRLYGYIGENAVWDEHTKRYIKG